MTAGQRWRKERPTAPGWYWFRTVGGGACVVRVVLHDDGDGNGLRLFVELDTDDLWPVSAYDSRYEWQGPITPHDQEAG